MILKSVTIFLCIVNSLTVCQYFENQYPEFIYTLENVTYSIDKADDSIATETDQLETRISGGDYAEVGYFPYMAVVHRLLGYRMFVPCAGTIISKRWVLTAAHCVMHHPQKFFVVFGVIDKSNIDYDFLRGPPGVSMIVTQAFIHTYFGEKKLENDIALLYMPQNIPFSDTIQPIKLAYQNENFVGHTAYVIGWGKDSTNRNSIRLKYTALPIIRDLECKRYWLDINPHQICTTSEFGRDACSGDSGGPLLVQRNNRHLQIGIVSYGDNFCPGNKPVVYTKVSSFINWIRYVMDYYPEPYIL